MLRFLFAEFAEHLLRERYRMIAWSEVTGGGTGFVSHEGLVLLRELADRTGLTAGLSAALPSPRAVHDRGPDLRGPGVRDRGRARMVSDFRVMGDQQEVFGPGASVPTAWRALKVGGTEVGRGRRGPRPPQGHHRGEQGTAARVAAGRPAAARLDRGPGPGKRHVHQAGRRRRPCA